MKVYHRNAGLSRTIHRLSKMYIVHSPFLK